MDNEITGLYVGTMNLVSASLTGDGMVRQKRLRHAFLKIQINPSMTRVLKDESLQYAEVGRELYALGDSASRMAFVTGRSISRSIKCGAIDPREGKAEEIFTRLVGVLLGKARTKGAVCLYSLPAGTPETEYRIIYHKNMMQEVLTRLGYRPEAMNEGLALVCSSLAHRDFTGIGISCGGGSLNVCVAHKARALEAFVVDRGGDWIDESAAKVLGIHPTKVTVAKEKGIDLQAPANQTEKAIIVYYRELSRYAIDVLKAKLESSKELALFQEPVDIVFSGAVALPAGFVQIFKRELTKVALPLKVGQIFLANNPEYAIARGCLIEAMSTSAHAEAHRTEAGGTDGKA